MPITRSGRRPHVAAGGPFVHLDTSITVAGGVAGAAPAGNGLLDVSNGNELVLDRSGDHIWRLGTWWAFEFDNISFRISDIDRWSFAFGTVTNGR